VTIGSRRRGTASTSAEQMAAGSPITAISAGLRCASAGSLVTIPSRVPGTTSGPAS
jgi:hypothetical protein